MRGIAYSGACILLLLITQSVEAQCPTETVSIMGNGEYDLSDVYSAAKPHLRMTEAQFIKCVSEYNDNVIDLKFAARRDVPVGVKRVLDEYGYLQVQKSQPAQDAGKIEQAQIIIQPEKETASDSGIETASGNRTVDSVKADPSDAQVMGETSDDQALEKQDSSTQSSHEPKNTAGASPGATIEENTQSDLVPLINASIFLLVLAGLIFAIWKNRSWITSVLSRVKEVRSKRDGKKEPGEESIGIQKSEKQEDPFDSYRKSQKDALPESFKDHGFDNEISEEKQKKLREDGIVGIKTKPRKVSES